jgi:hypothetical protein
MKKSNEIGKRLYFSDKKSPAVCPAGPENAS